MIRLLKLSEFSMNQKLQYSKTESNERNEMIKNHEDNIILHAINDL